MCYHFPASRLGEHCRKDVREDCTSPSLGSRHNRTVVVINAVVVACTKSIQDQVSQYPIMPAWRRGSLSLTPSWGAVDRWCLLGQERQAGFFQGRGLWQVAQAPVSGSTPHPCTYGQRWLASMSYKMGNKKLEGERGKSEKSWLGLYMCVKLLNHE